MATAAGITRFSPSLTASARHTAKGGNFTKRCSTGFKNGRRYDIVRPKYSEMSTHADYKSMKPYIDIAEKAKTDAMDAMEKALSGEKSE